jgi:Uma2 family endonuclease
MSAIAKSYLSEQDYLKQERNAFDRNEYYNGTLFPMPPAKASHSKIVATVTAVLALFLKHTDYAVMNTQMRIYNAHKFFFVYPDVVVTDANEKYSDSEFDNLLNPIIVAEIFSATTQDYDRGTKFMLYRSIPSLKHYVLISSLEHSIEIYTRDGEQWILNTADGLEDELYLSAIDYRFKLKDMYVQVPDLGK